MRVTAITDFYIHCSCTCMTILQVTGDHSGGRNFVPLKFHFRHHSSLFIELLERWKNLFFAFLEKKGQAQHQIKTPGNWKTQLDQPEII